MAAYLTLDSSVIVASLREQEEKRRIGFEPAMSFEEGVRELVARANAGGRGSGLMSRLRSLRRRGLWRSMSSGSETR